MRDSSGDRINLNSGQGNNGFLSGGSKSTKTSVHSANLIIEKLNNENKILLQMISDLKTERNTAQSKALVME